MTQSEFLSAAIAAARAAEPVIQRYFRADIAVERKADDSPVTRADVEAEAAIRETLGSRFPDHDFYGEELGRSQGASDYLWLIDPIDGTKSFVRGYPLFSTQIALSRGGRMIVGVSNASVFGELAWAERDGGAWLNDRPIRVSGCEDLGRAVLSCGNIQTLSADTGAWARLGRLARSVDRFRGYGDFLHYHLLAAGHIDIVLESDLNILDIAALSLIVEEAGGVCSQLDGGPLSLQSTTLLASASPALHEQVLAALDGGG